MRMFCLRQSARDRLEVRPGNLASYGAGSNSHLCVVANAFCLAHVAAGHHVKPIAVFSKPDWSSDARTALAEGGERDIFLAVDFGRYWSGHDEIRSLQLILLPLHRYFILFLCAAVGRGSPEGLAD